MLSHKARSSSIGVPVRCENMHFFLHSHNDEFLISLKLGNSSFCNLLFAESLEPMFPVGSLYTGSF